MFACSFRGARDLHFRGARLGTAQALRPPWNPLLARTRRLTPAFGRVPSCKVHNAASFPVTRKALGFTGTRRSAKQQAEWIAAASLSSGPEQVRSRQDIGQPLTTNYQLSRALHPLVYKVVVPIGQGPVKAVGRPHRGRDG